MKPKKSKIKSCGTCAVEKDARERLDPTTQKECNSCDEMKKKDIEAAKKTAQIPSSMIGSFYITDTNKNVIAQVQDIYFESRNIFAINNTIMAENAIVRFSKYISKIK